VSGRAPTRPGPVFAGVDGGGTRTRVVLVDGSGLPIARGEGGPGLIGREGPEACGRALAALVRQVAEEAGQTLPAAALHAGLAGAGEREARERVLEVLAKSGVAERIAVVSDAEIALAAAFGSGPGILLIAGTGSAVFGRGADGRLARCGGWGAVLGDEGGGHALGIGALRTVLRVADELEMPTGLVPAVLEATDTADPRALPTWAGSASKAEVAGLAPLVLRLAAAGDPAADRIVEEAVGALSACVVSLARRLAPWSEGVPVAWTGGVTMDAGFAGRLEARIRAEVPEARIARDRLDPALAAARTAAGLDPRTANTATPVRT
jgi:glucosamine kinase